MNWMSLKTSAFAAGLVMFTVSTWAADDAMQKHMQEMQQTMQQMQQTKDPAQRQQLMEKHMSQMQATMKDMQARMGEHGKMMNHQGMQHAMPEHGIADDKSMQMCHDHMHMMQQMMQHMQVQQQELKALQHNK
jgi:hypothetical protein